MKFVIFALFILELFSLGLGQTCVSDATSTHFKKLVGGANTILVGEQQAAVNGFTPHPVPDFYYSLSTYSRLVGGNVMGYVQNNTAVEIECDTDPDTLCLSVQTGAANCSWRTDYDTFTCCCNDGYERTQNCTNNLGATNMNGDCYADTADGTIEYGIACDDINECLDSSSCSGGEKNGSCNNFAGGYECDCNTGYEWNNSTKDCEDVDECLTNPCSTGTCENFPGGYNCTCTGDYVPNPSLTACMFDLCTVSANNCSSVGACTYDPSTNETTCACDSGYTNTGATPLDDCTDVDECIANTTSCDSTALCNNTIGSYECYCNGTDNRHPRTIATDNTLVCDVNNCPIDADHCGINATCTNDLSNDGTEICTCSEPGYPYGDPDVQCYPDPCVGSTLCNTTLNEACVPQNTTGVPYAECFCGVGYEDSDNNNTSNVLNCTYVNLCLTDNGGCDVTSTTCEDNGDATRTCNCNAGYENPNGTACFETYVCTNATFGIVLDTADSDSDVETNLKTCLMILFSATDVDVTMTVNGTEMVGPTPRTYAEMTQICVNKFDGDEADLQTKARDISSNINSQCYNGQRIYTGFDECSTGTNTYNCSGCVYQHGRSSCCDSSAASSSELRFQLDTTVIDCINASTAAATMQNNLEASSICGNSSHNITVEACGTTVVFNVQNSMEDIQDVYSTMALDYPTLVDYNDCVDIDNLISAPCAQDCSNFMGSYECNCYRGITEDSTGVCVDPVTVGCTTTEITISLDYSFASANKITGAAYVINGYENDQDCFVTEVTNYTVTIPAGKCGFTLTGDGSGGVEFPSSTVTNDNSSLAISAGSIISITFRCKTASNSAISLTINGGDTSSQQAATAIALGDQVIDGTITFTLMDQTYANPLLSTYEFSPGENIYLLASLAALADFPTYKINVLGIQVSDNADLTNPSDILIGCQFQSGYYGGNLINNGEAGSVKISFPIPSVASGKNVYFIFEVKTCTTTCSDICTSYTNARRRKRNALTQRIKRSDGIDMEEYESKPYYQQFVILMAEQNKSFFAAQSTYMYALVGLGVIIAVVLLAAVLLFAMRRRRSSARHEMEPTHMNMYAIGDEKPRA